VHSQGRPYRALTLRSVHYIARTRPAGNRTGWRDYDLGHVMPWLERCHDKVPLLPAVVPVSRHGAAVTTCPKTPLPSLYSAGRALLAARARMREQGRDRAVVGVHPCARCRAFHLTSDPKSANSSWTRRALDLARR
jgi:hypothetical protein